MGIFLRFHHKRGFHIVWEPLLACLPSSSPAGGGRGGCLLGSGRMMLGSVLDAACACASCRPGALYNPESSLYEETAPIFLQPKVLTVNDICPDGEKYLIKKPLKFGSEEISTYICSVNKIVIITSNNTWIQIQHSTISRAMESSLQYSEWR